MGAMKFIKIYMVILVHIEVAKDHFCGVQHDPFPFGLHMIE